MEKVLIYTISDFSKNSYECIELLYKSLKVKNSNFDFCVISNKLYENSKFPIIVDNCSDSYIGMLKFSERIPKGYDRYVYLDNDILCFEDLNNMYNDNVLSLVEEKPIMGTSEWFCYQLASDAEKLKMYSYKGFNAGTFIFSDMSFVDNVRLLLDFSLKNFNLFRYNPVYSKALQEGLLEQTSFNYAIFKELPELKYLNLEDKVLLNADNRRLNETSKTIFHFSGWSGELTSKYEKMVKFCEYNNIIL